MKLAFTTLGCPDWDLERIIKNAVENGYNGIDFRGLLGELDIYKLKEFSSNVKETVRQFKEASLEIPCFSSSVKLVTQSQEEYDRYIEELRQYALLCKEFNTPYIRVFGGAIGKWKREEAIEIAEKNVHDYLAIVEKYNVKLLLETHDDWTDSRNVRELVQRVSSNHFLVLWDIHHPYRTIGEKPETTWDNLGEWVCYTHWKDSYVKKETKRGYQLCLLGEGDIPLPDIMALLKDNEYDGYFTLEWEKKWCPELEEPEIAFKQFSKYMKNILI
ncbi:sugar phosphate isomerase/epimerase family protein [Niallia circulans]|uniref:Sugar phosphate isomerase/epimerase n=1 Tax=Niallia circulans TaxID=1397 RepID=A0A941JNE3_NIACI|nr:sugar phosphate isomerase/epimerase family protein [Niallia circulans]MCB5237810.1 sugar phosphate isomerase/epimerase [Niallia circulans]